MSGKIAIIESEFSQISSNINSIHQELTASYQSILETINSIVSDGGPIVSSEFSPKVTGLTSSFQSDVLSRLETVFETTETAISDFESMIMNIDTSC